MKILIHNSAKLLQFDNLSSIDGITHVVSTRSGGISKDNYATMNLSEYCGDDSSTVSNNREIVSAFLHIPSENIQVPCQIHGDKIAVVDESFKVLSKENRKQILNGVDALISTVPDLFVAVSTADCVPVLLYAPDRKIVAAIHAGWRGTVQQIVSKTVLYLKEMYDCNVKEILAGIGPSIGLDAFEVGEEVVEAFNNAGLVNDLILKRNLQTGKAHIDLWEANRQQLLDVGLDAKHIEVASICTYTNNDDFFSARRLGIQSGRMLSGIMINERHKW